MADGAMHSWRLAAMGLVVAGAGFLLGRRSALAQVLARGVAWAIVIPTAFVSFLAIRHGYWPGAAMLAQGLGAALALFLSRPMLENAEARSEFAPVAFRRLLLASAGAAVGFGVAIGRFALELAAFHATGPAIAMGALAASLTLAGVGVARMRSWGLLLGAATSLAAVALAPLSALGWPMAIPAVPGLMMLAAIVLGRLGIGQEEAPSDALGARLRVGPSPDALAELEAGRVRVAGELEDFDEELAAPPSRRAAQVDHHKAGDRT